jgi:hypothetical protein
MSFVINIQSLYFVSPNSTLQQIVDQNKILGDASSRIDPFLKVNVLRLPSYHLNTNIMFTDSVSMKV